MNRDKVIIVILVLLLAASLAGNWVLWNKSRSGAAVAAKTPGPEARRTAPRERGDPGLYEIKANPEMKGRLGRIVLSFAEGAEIKGTRTTVYKAGGADMLRADYGPVTAELPPGSYDLEVCGRKISSIPVESGKDTNVRSGVLRLHGAANTRFTIHEPGAKDFFHVAYGNAGFGLPAGEYEVDVSGQREKVTIEPGKITEF